MNSLYSRLARQWDTLFPPDTERVNFLNELLENFGSGKRVIEVGCGTGATAIDLAGRGCSVAASDLDSDMIAIARTSAGRALDADAGDYYPDAGSVNFSTADMIGALDAAPFSSANLILCLGNTLPHLTESGELARFFEAVRRALVPGGILILQILNYSRISKLGGLELPPLQGDGLLFRRRQVPVPETGLISFQTEVESDGIVERRTHNLIPITIDVLAEYSSDAGFAAGEIFSDWNNTLFKPDSPWLAAVYTRIGETD